MVELEQRRQYVLKQIRSAEKSAQRQLDSVHLIAVSKTFPADQIRQLYQCGQRHFGENYIQEWQGKIAQLSDCSEIIWHIIGHVQSNKTKVIAEHADWLHTLDRLKIAERLNHQRPVELSPLNVCIEINIANESTKHGISPDELLPLAKSVLLLPRLKLRGLMCVAQADATEIQLREQFNYMAQLLRTLQVLVPQADTLSMGMSNDMPIAIECGATMVRVGTAIFGKR